MSQTEEPINPSPIAALGRVLRETFLTLVVLASIMIGVPLACVAVYLVYLTVVPPYSATMQIPELRTTLTLRFFYIWDVQTENGRYLTIETPHDHIKIAMTAWDWAHNSRTSVYLTPAGKIAIVGPMGDDYLVSLDPLTTKKAKGSSDDWTYLGAFDYENFHTPADWNNLSRVGRELRFITAAEQVECIPMRGSTIYEWQVRKAARQDNCKDYARSPAK